MNSVIWASCLLISAVVTQAGEKPVAKHDLLFPATGVATKQAVLLAIDDTSFPLKRNLCCYLSQPKVRREPVLMPSRDNPRAPDFLAAHFYGTVLFDQGKFRMWYYPCHLGRNPDWPPKLRGQAERWKAAVIPGPLCYAESEDGIHWRKPNLGQLLFKGSRDNNALSLPSALTGDACVIKDESDPAPARRYKLAFWTQFDPWEFPTMRLATSPDGLVWKAAPKPPIQAFLEHASFYRHNGLYIANSQTFLPGESGRERGRQGTAWVSTDFDHWLQESAESFALPQAAGPKRDEVHLGVGAASFGNVAVGLYCIWHNDAQFGKISGDLGLVVSNDGIAFREPVKGHRWLTTEQSPVTPVPGQQYPTILCQANGIVNVGDETRIYHGRWRNASYDRKPKANVEDYYAEVALATIPRDRWGALGLIPGASEGSVWSTPVTLPADGCQIRLNADDLSALGVEVADEQFKLLPDFSGDFRGTAVETKGLIGPVRWPKGSFSQLGGRTVRLRVLFRKVGAVAPRLFAVYLESLGRLHGAAKAGTDAQIRSSVPKPPATQTAMKLIEFPIRVGDRTVTGLLAEPQEGHLAPDPALLLTFASTCRETMTVSPYDEPAKVFVAAGHRALSFDLPEHGGRVTPGREAGIAGMCQALVAGQDPFKLFVSDGQAAIDACLQRGLVRPGRIFACGVSRGGYCALRLAAADPRISGVAGLAPVTDWRQLREFAQVKSRSDVIALDLENYAAKLAGRPVFLAIGNRDDRVGTESCLRFATRLLESETRLGLRESQILFHVVGDSPGHSLDTQWRRAGANLLVDLSRQALQQSH
jgi:dienelactone hydrolase